jgi:hypothetical protein
MNYLMLYVDTLRQYKRLSDTEFGRAIRAVLQFLEDGTEANLPGKECIMYDVLREQTERDRKSYEKKMAAQRENGSKGGRPRKKAETQENPKNPWVFSETQESQKTQEKEKEEYIPPYNPPTGGIGGGEDELLAISKQNNRVYDKAQACGFVCNMATLDRLTALIASHGADSVFSALDECVKAQASNFRYLEKVLENKKAESKTKAVSYETFF